MKIQQKRTLIIVSAILLLYILSQQFNISSITENQSEFNENIKEIDEKTPKVALSLEWNKTWDIGLPQYGDYGNGIATDSEGNVYVAGLSELSFDWYAFLIKYDSNGNYLWNKTWQADFTAQAWDITNDTSDNVYVAGNIGFTSNVIKFNSTGDVQWNETYFPEADTLDSIIYSSDEFIYVTGTDFDLSGSNITLLKINSTNGQLEGFSMYETVYLYTSASDGAIDSLNTIYITGRNETSYDNDTILLKYDSSCNLIWNVTWNNTFGSTHNEKGSGLIIDSKDNIYVTGYNQTDNDYDIILLKYDNLSNLLWQKSWDNSNGKDEGWDIDIDSEDSIYVIGSEQNSTGHNNSILLKFNDNGIQIWNQSWGGTEDDEGRGLLVINSEKIFITGATESFAKGYKPDMFIAYFQDESISNQQPTQPLSGGDDDDDDRVYVYRLNIFEILTSPIGLIIIGGLIGIVVIIVIIKIKSSSKSRLKEIERIERLKDKI